GADGKLFTSDDSIATHTITVGDGSDATITKITVSLNTENFIYTEPNRGEKFSSTAKELAIDVNTFRYDTDTGSTDGTEAALDNEIEVSIGTNDYEVMQAGKDVTNDYFVYNEDGSLKIVTRDEPDYDRPLVNIYFDGGEGADNQWKIVRNNFDQIKLKLTFSTIKGDDVVNVEFNSPYTATPSATNITTTIYSGTTFVLATDGQPMDYAEEVEYSGNPSDYTDGNYYINVGDIYYLLGNHNYYTADNSYSDVEVEGETEQGYGYISGGKVVLIEVDAKICAGTLDTNANPLYTLKANTDESATFTISNGLTGNIGLKEGKYMFVVPEVTRKTNTNFAISFTYSGSTTRVTTLNLTILPNVIIQGKPSEQDLTLNDYDDKYYNLDGLKLASYSTEGKYYSYGTPTALENVDNIEYGVVYYKQTFEYVDGNTYRYDVDGKRYVLVDSEEDCEDLLHEYVALYTRVSNEQILTNGATYTETTSYIENNTYRYDADTNSYIALSQENFNTLLASGKKAYTTKIEDEQILNYYLTYTETTEYEKDITYKYNIADKTYTKVATEEDFKTEYQEVEDYIEGIKYFKDDGGSYTEIEINSLAEFENNKAITALYTVTKFYIRSNQLQVGIIENIGNYYANVMVYARSETQSLVGTFDFKIASLSQITNERGADIEIVANREITYTLEQLKHIFNLRRNKDKVGTLVDVEINEIYDHTAKLLINKKYETVDTYAEGCTYAYTTTDVYIEGNTYILDGEDYVLVESQEAFDTLVEGVEKFKFVKLTSEDDLTGLKLYKFSGISVYYNGFGQINEGKINLTYDGFVDFVNYTSVATYVLDGKAYDMTTGEVYTMKVLPYIIEPSTDVLLADRSYNLIGGSAPLFIANSSNEEEVGVKFFEFSSPEAVNYTITNEEDVYDIKFVKNGNYYTTTLPTTLTYNNGLKLDYEQVFTIVNSNEVNINYPFDVKDEDDVYGTFNTTLSQFTTSATDINIVDTLIDIALYNNVSQNDIYTPYDEELEEGNAYYYQNMMGEYVKTTTKVEGVNQYYVLADNWSSKIALGYDIALKNPNNITTINLSEDELLKLCRYTTTTYSVATREIGGATYYIYNTNTHAFEFVEDVVARAELPTGKYYVANNNEYVSDSISSIELVAVSSDYGVTNTQLESVKNSISFSNGTIKLDSNMITSGYLAFKVYSSTGAYGYYILKFINDTNFASVIDPNLSRRNAVITEPITTDTEVYGLISTKNSFVNASHINEDLLTEGYNNVYLFMVDCSDGAKIKVNGESRIYQQGERIVHDALLMPSNNTEHIELAVVVSNGASLVHICNYTLTLTPDVKVEENQTLIDDVINPDYYQYQAKALSYDFDNFVQVTTKPERWNEYA
ncbi:MAG: hypothetical protein IJA72_02060, partial [Clostridia bacterium]|nr:hypothetical protein [Clostridia bacterium]